VASNLVRLFHFSALALVCVKINLAQALYKCNKKWLLFHCAQFPPENKGSMNETTSKNDLDEMLAWARKCGHYAVKQMIENFRQYRQALKEKEAQALQDRRAGDD